MPVIEIFVFSVAPEIDSHPADEIVLIGSSFSLSCKVTGNPVPSMQWILPNSGKVNIFII